MQLKYGTYSWAVNGVKPTQTLVLLKNKGGQAYAQRQTMRVEGQLLTTSGTPQNDLTLQSNTMLSALNVWYQDLILYHDDSTASYTSLVNAGSTTGVQIIDGPNFPSAQGAEYASYRTFNFTAEAEYPLTGSAALWLDFGETLTFSGGGSIVRFRRAINGPAPQKQIVYPLVEYRLVQAGFAVGYLASPNPAAMKYPGNLVEAPEITKTNPERMGKPGQYQGYRTTWKYVFESAAPMPATPTLWIS